jgi:ribosomal protein S18 acetylase RimI-like enzyme
LRIRPATSADAESLAALEAEAFETDRISRRSFRTLIERPTAVTLVAVDGATLLGYVMILFRSGTGMARLYSLAVRPAAQGRGVGRRLLEAAEQAAEGHDRLFLRLEVREGHTAAIGLYESAGYRRIGRLPSYYADGQAAIRMEKRLRDVKLPPARVPFFEQSTDFTCGAACLVMALAGLRGESFLDPVWEIRLWREATTVFMQSGLGGCEPFGLALAAHQHGLQPEVYCSSQDMLFLDSVRDPKKRWIMELAQTDFRHRAREVGIPVRNEAFTLAELRRRLADGQLAVVLVSGYLMMGKKVPHWVLAHGDDGRHILIHDPWVEEAAGETPADAANIPIPVTIFDRIARYGRTGLRAAVFLTPKSIDV